MRYRIRFTGTVLAALFHCAAMSDEQLRSGLECGFIDHTAEAQEEFIPQLITNNPENGEKVISSLSQEMNSCDRFAFSVAFISYSGVNPLLNEFRNLHNKNVKGRIIASQYQNFTEPKALSVLASFPNIELRIVTEDYMKMHTKCYIFKRGENYNVILGSSNLTNSALCENGEWNIRFNSSQRGEIAKDILEEFEKVWEHATPVT